jgi:hypothetical protein
LYERLEGVERQQLIQMMVRQIRITPTRMELELYDHPTVIEDWNDGPEGWFRMRLDWLPDSIYRRTILVVGSRICLQWLILALTIARASVEEKPELKWAA